MPLPFHTYSLQEAKYNLPYPLNFQRDPPGIWLNNGFCRSFENQQTVDSSRVGWGVNSDSVPLAPLALLISAAILLRGRELISQVGWCQDTYDFIDQKQHLLNSTQKPVGSHCRTENAGRLLYSNKVPCYALKPCWEWIERCSPIECIEVAQSRGAKGKIPVASENKDAVALSSGDDRGDRSSFGHCCCLIP